MEEMSVATNEATEPEKAVGVKLSDLNAINQYPLTSQYLLTRAGITLTAIGLIATASGLLKFILPDAEAAAPGGVPFALYFAAITLAFGALNALQGLPLSPRFSMGNLLFDRLMRNSDDRDHVTDNLRKEYVFTIRYRFSHLATAYLLLHWGLIAIYAHIAGLFTA